MSLCNLVRRLKQTQHHLDIRATQWASELCAVGFRLYAGKYVVFLWLLVLVYSFGGSQTEVRLKNT